MAGAWWWGAGSMPSMCGRYWRWWSRRRDRVAEFAGDGPRAGNADLAGERGHGHALWVRPAGGAGASRDRKSTRLNSSHSQISYAVFCLKKKKKQNSAFISPQSESDSAAVTLHATK